MTQVLFVSGDDLSALAFEEKYNGKPVGDVIPTLDYVNGEVIATANANTLVQYELMEFDMEATEVLLKFCENVKSKGNYQTNSFYAENHVLGEIY